MERIQNDVLICTGNEENKKSNQIPGSCVGKNGLVAGHAYSLLRLARIISNREEIKLVRVRNPWGNTEWSGPWSDKSPLWDTVSKQEKERIQFVDEDDGAFWMTFDDWTREFETTTICHLPTK